MKEGGDRAEETYKSGHCDGVEIVALPPVAVRLPPTASLSLPGVRLSFFFSCLRCSAEFPCYGCAGICQQQTDAMRENLGKFKGSSSTGSASQEPEPLAGVAGCSGRSTREGPPAEGCDAETCSTLVFFVNGKRVVETAVDPEWTLLSYLRDKLRLKGTKLGCGEGGCGACSVMLSSYDHGLSVTRHCCVNACLTPVAAVHGMAVTTVEGVGSLKTRLHAVQERLAEAHGSQCGFCTPGIVMAAYALLRNRSLPSTEDLLESLAGNLCRCTGYRPILDGLASLTAKAPEQPPPAGCGKANCCRLRPSSPGEVEDQRNGSVHDPAEGSAITNGFVADQIIQVNGRANGVIENEGDAGDDYGTTCQADEKGFHSKPLDGSIRLKPDELAAKSSLIISNQDKKNRLNTGVHAPNKSLRDSEYTENGDAFDIVRSTEEFVQRNGLRSREFINSDVNDGRVKRSSFKIKEASETGGVSTNGTAAEAEEGLPAARSAGDDDKWSLNSFKAHDHTQDIIFPPQLKVSQELEKQTLMYRGPRVTYWRPTSLNHLLALKHRHPEAKVVVGNTEVGVEVNVRSKRYPVLINPTKVPEMKCLSLEESGLLCGASVTLNTLQEALKHQVDTKPEYMTRSFSAILEMLKWFAGKQIRNVASIGGNIMTSSPISDLNPVLMAAGAHLTFCSFQYGKREVILDQTFFTGYRQNSALPTEVLLSVHIPYTQQEEYIQSFKQSRRPDDDITIVNAAMRVRMAIGTCRVAHLSLAFGGMAATTVHAPRTMKELVGQPWDASLLQKGTDLLLEDLPLSPSAPGGMTDYRRTLTISLFFKFYLKVRGWLREHLGYPVEPLSQDELSATEPFHLPPFSSTQSFQQVPESQGQLDPVGRPLVHASAFNQTTGEAVYVDDIPRLEDELHAALVLSSHAHAKILAIDDARALKVEGVEAFFCARDLPGERNVTGPLSADEEVFAREKVVCVGQVVGLVVAKDHATARQAAALVDVHYQDLAPPILTIQDAIREQSWWKPQVFNKGSVEDGFKAAAHTVEGEMYMGGQEHFYMETNVHIVVPKGENNELEMFSSTQNPTGTQRLVAKALGIPSSRVVVRVKRLGGGFGGKETRTCSISIPAAVAATRLNRPVRIRLERQEDMVVTGGRHPVLCRWKAGFTPEGRLTALEAQVFANAGYSLDLSSPFMTKLLCSLDNAYNHQNLRVTGYICRTNLPSSTAFRGFGTPQAVMFIEDIMSHISTFLGRDPSEVRETNMYKAGDTTIVSHKLDHDIIRKCWRQVMDSARAKERQASVQDFNRRNTYRKRGLAVVPLNFGVGFERVLNQAGALLHAYVDGSLLLTHAGVEMGQGLHTKLIQVASRALGVAPESVFIAETSTDKVPNTSPTAASVSTDLNGMAVLNACQELAARLEPYKRRSPDATWKDWVEAAYEDQVSLSATGFYRIPDLDFDLDTMTGQPFNYYSNGAAVTEVEIDCLTGRHVILRTDVVMDVGNPLNPAVDIGQIEGAFMQGVGLVTLEELCYSPEGVLLTRGPGAYKIPGFQDIPCEFHVSLLKDSPNPRAVFSSKAVGEPPLLLAISVFQAIKAAVAAARKEHHLPQLFRLDSPATVEKIRLACCDPLSHKVKVATQEPQENMVNHNVC